MLVKSKFFLQFVEKIEKLKLSLSKQHSKMLKMKSEMLKTRKKTKQSSSVNFPGNLPNPGNPEDPGKFPEYPGRCHLVVTLQMLFLDLDATLW